MSSTGRLPAISGPALGNGNTYPQVYDTLGRIFFLNAHGEVLIRVALLSHLDGELRLAVFSWRDVPARERRDLGAGPS